MRHFATSEFWWHYRNLPQKIQRLADRNFGFIERDPRHPSLRLKKVGIYWSARVGIGYRAVASECAEGLSWFWIGKHSEYERLIQ